MRSELYQAYPVVVRWLRPPGTSCLPIPLIALLLISSVALSQDGSLLRRPISPAPMARGPQQLPPDWTANPGQLQPMPYIALPPRNDVTLQGASWIYEPPTPARTYRENDIVTIRVDEISQVRALGNAQSRRNSIYDALLKDWIQFDGLDMKPAAQNDGDPRVQGTLNRLDRADATMENRESIAFNIAARVVDIRPNGDLVLEANKTIVVNENIFETALTGTCRPVDITPDNVVLSRDVLDLRVTKRDRGHLRDGYKRGWLTRWFETLSPF